MTRPEDVLRPGYLDDRVAVVTGNYRGSAGTSVTLDGGASWQRVSDQGFHTVDCTADGTCWAAGATGQVGWARG